MITPTPQADPPQDKNHPAHTVGRATPRRRWESPRLERAELSATRFGGIIIFDGSDFDLTSIPV